jgi:hypothetical protein
MTLPSTPNQVAGQPVPPPPSKINDSPYQHDQGLAHIGWKPTSLDEEVYEVDESAEDPCRRSRPKRSYTKAATRSEPRRRNACPHPMTPVV